MLTAIFRTILVGWLWMFLRRRADRMIRGVGLEATILRRAVSMVTPVLGLIWSNRRWLKKVA